MAESPIKKNKLQTKKKQKDSNFKQGNQDVECKSKSKMSCIK